MKDYSAINELKKVSAVITIWPYILLSAIFFKETPLMILNICVAGTLFLISLFAILTSAYSTYIETNSLYYKKHKDFASTLECACEERDINYDKLMKTGVFLTAFILPIGFLYWLFLPIIVAWAPNFKKTQKRVKVIEAKVETEKDQFLVEAEQEVEEFWKELKEGKS